MDFDKIIENGASQLAGSLGSMAVQGLQGAIFGNGAQRDFQRNKQLMDYQFQLNKRAALSQKEIQMAQGLNPLLGQGGQMNAVSIGNTSNETSQQSQRQANAIAQQQQATQQKLADSQIALQDAERRKARAEELNIVEDTAHKTLDNLSYNQRYFLEIEGTKLKNKFQELENAKSDEERKKIIAEARAITQGMYNDIARVGIEKQNAKTAERGVAVQEKIAPSQIASNYASAHEKETQSLLNTVEGEIQGTIAKYQEKMSNAELKQFRSLTNMYAWQGEYYRQQGFSQADIREKIQHDMFMNNVPESVRLGIEAEMNFDAKIGKIVQGLTGLKAASKIMNLGVQDSGTNWPVKTKADLDPLGQTSYGGSYDFR